MLLILQYFYIMLYNFVIEFSFDISISRNVLNLYCRNLFDEQRVPNLAGDSSVMHDIHCVRNCWYTPQYFSFPPNLTVFLVNLALWSLTMVSTLLTNSSVLKLYFRLLPTPLVTYDLYPHLVLASKQSEPRRGEKFREILARLPGAHYRWERNRKQFVLDLISCPAEQWTGWCVISIECLFTVKEQAWLQKIWQ